jgi:hypothetical protein
MRPVPRASTLSRLVLALTAMGTAVDAACAQTSAEDAQLNAALRQFDQTYQQACVDQRQNEDYMVKLCEEMRQTRASMSAEAPARRVQTAPRPAPMPMPPSSPFGPLPAGVGNQAQRDFWASRCQYLPDDGSAASLGCRQTYQMLTNAPRAPVPYPQPGTARTQGMPEPSYRGANAIHIPTPPLRPTATTSGSRPSGSTRTPNSTGSGPNRSIPTTGQPVTLYNCISDRVERRGTQNPVIVLTNRCNAQVYWSLCVIKTGEFGPSRYPGTTAAGSSSRYELWLPKSEGYSYRYNWSANDPAPAASCSL